MEFLSIEDASRRLQSAIFRHENEPVIVHDVHNPRGSKFTVDVATITIDSKVYNIPVEDLDLSPVPLGNVFEHGETFYVARTPSRVAKHGLHMDNYRATKLGGGLGGARLSINSPAIRTTILGIYTPFDECVNFLEKGFTHHIPFSRYFSISRNKMIYYKCRNDVGKYKDGKITLDNKYTYLQELLDEALA